MATTQTGVVLRHIRRLAAVPSSDSDRELLGRFVAQRDEAAFTALVRRHGPLVLGVCRRVLGNSHDAEDAFQAAFLVLARKAHTIRAHESVAGWLHRVAFHLAMRARAQGATRLRHERAVLNRSTTDPLTEVSARELMSALDEELQALPECYRTPLILCYLESLTRDEAARKLGATLATLKRRLEQGRERLRVRLERRGVSLPAALAAIGLTSAAVPQALAKITVQAAHSAASGNVAILSSPAARLAAESLRTMSAGQWKVLVIAVLFMGLVGGGWFAHSTPADEPKAVQKQEAAPIVLDEAKSMTISGRVLSPDGKPAAEASVVVVARQGVLLSSWHGWTSLRNEILEQGKTDAQGRFRLTVPRTDPLMNVRIVRVVTMKNGAGLAWKALDPDAKEASVELRLTAVQPVRGRIVDIQGEPAAGLKIHVARITRKPEKDEHEDDAAIRPPAALPLAATTDKKGEFVFEIFGPDVKLELEIKDPRYQRKDEWFVETADKKACENLRLVLPPGQVVEGRVIYADTRKPVPHARLMIASPYIVDDQTDADGRFRISLFAGQFSKGDVGVQAFPPDGEPYLPGSGGLRFDKGVVHREIEIALPPGMLLLGKITETESGKPVAGAIVEYNGDTHSRARSGPDGRYQLAASPASAARLMVTHPSGEYLTQVIGSAGGGLDKPVGDPSYYHAVIAAEVKPDEKVKEVNISLRRGVTIAGSLVGADDKPVASAVMFVSAHKPRSEKTMHPVHVRDGRFEVRGCDPEREYQLIFLEHPGAPRPLMMAESLQSFGQLWMAELVNGKDARGASVKVLAKTAAAKPLKVRIGPCGSAKLRFTDAAGKPKVDFIPWLQLVVTPGPQPWKAIEEKTLAAEVVTLAGAYGDQPPGQPKTDAQGNVTYTGLIPGATYRVKTYGDNMGRNIVLKDLTVEAGKTAEIEVVVK